MYRPAATSPRTSVRLALGWWLALVLLSLYPLSGWRDQGGSAWAFLFAPPPRVAPSVDLALNLLAYLPLGFAAYLALALRLRPLAAGLSALLLAAATSCGVELLQNFLPTRVASNLDLACNTLGAGLGVIAAARWGGVFARQGALGRRWRGVVRQGVGVDSGLLLLGLWLLAQWTPSQPLFAVGGLQQWVESRGWAPFTPARYMAWEAISVACGALAAGLLAALVLQRWRRRGALAVLAGGVGVKALGAGLLLSSVLLAPLDAARGWFSPGAGIGAGIGALLVLIGAALRPRWQRRLALLALGLGVLAANALPGNPYHLPALPAFPAAQWLNLNGLSQWMAALWPLLAALWLWRRREEE